MRLLFLAAAFVCAASTLTAKENGAIEMAVRRTFAPYSDSRIIAPDAARDTRWTARTRNLINRWKSRPSIKSRETDVSPLSNGNWLCQCQEWDQERFRITSISQKMVSSHHAVVDVRYRVTARDKRRLTMIMLHERNTWRVDDLLFEGQRESLSAQLQNEILGRAAK